MTSVQARERPGGARRCSFCREEVAAAELVGCPLCGIALHADCWEELDRCPSPGCQGAPAALGPDRCPACFGPGPGAGAHCPGCGEVFLSLGLVARPPARSPAELARRFRDLPLAEKLLVVLVLGFALLPVAAIVGLFLGG